jgi:hypothetical protein
MSVVDVDVAKWLSTTISQLVSATMLKSIGIGGAHVHEVRAECW